LDLGSLTGSSEGTVLDQMAYWICNQRRSFVRKQHFDDAKEVNNSKVHIIS
jgi:hypothetical protein